MLVHEFLVVTDIPEHVTIGDYDRNLMVKIDDDFILHYHVPIRKVKMNCRKIGNIIDGLAYHGTTILDTQMAANLKAELLPYIHASDECKKLITVLDVAISQKKYIIHFGV